VVRGRRHGHLGGSILAAIFHQPAEAYASILVSPHAAIIRLLRLRIITASGSGRRLLSRHPMKTLRPPAHTKIYWRVSRISTLLSWRRLLLPRVLATRFPHGDPDMGAARHASDLLIGYTGMVSFGHSDSSASACTAPAAHSSWSSRSIFGSTSVCLAGIGGCRPVRRHFSTSPARTSISPSHDDLLAIFYVSSSGGPR